MIKVNLKKEEEIRTEHCVSEYEAFILKDERTGEIRALLCAQTEDDEPYLIELLNFGVTVYQYDTIEEYMCDWTEHCILIKAFKDKTEFELALTDLT